MIFVYYATIHAPMRTLANTTKNVQACTLADRDPDDDEPWPVVELGAAAEPSEMGVAIGDVGAYVTPLALAATSNTDPPPNS